MIKKELFSLGNCKVTRDSFEVKGRYVTILNARGKIKTTLGHERDATWTRWLEESNIRAISLGTEADGRQYWLVRQQVYSEAEKLDAAAVYALVAQKESAKQRALKRAFSTVDLQQTEIRREGIPEDVKIFVWRRDGGKCVKCGGNSNLEFDHIIPLAMGGSNTARNLQLLCEPCNREKGPHLS